MTSWLRQQRKNELIALSEEAGFKQKDDLKKDEIVERLDAHLKANGAKLSRNPEFQQYYASRATPFKPRPTSAGEGVTSDDGGVKTVVKARGRRATKVKSEAEDSDPTTASPSQALAKVTKAVTPARPTGSRQLPPAPADLANDIEEASTRFYTSISERYDASFIPGSLDFVRETCSSVTGVQAAFTLVELWALQREIMPRRYLYSTPTIDLGPFTIPSIPVSISDVFAILQPEFWSALTLWTMTSLAVPLLFGYFFNLTTREVRRQGERVRVPRTTIDPLVSNVTKALVSYVVYGQMHGFGLASFETITRVQIAMCGGWHGLVTGAGVSALGALYEAAQKK